MSFGPGKYDEWCTVVRQETCAAGAIVMIFGGNKGTGFSAQLPGPLVGSVPSILRDIANSIEADMKESPP